MRSADHLLNVSVVGLAFRAGLEAAETFQTALNLDPKARCWAIVSADEAPLVRAGWEGGGLSSLLIIQSSAEHSAELAWEMLHALPEGPVAVLLANLPVKSRGFLPNRRAAKLVRYLESAHHDLQIHLHRAEWLRRPPRLR